jgi:hypothetical protein
VTTTTTADTAVTQILVVRGRQLLPRQLQDRIMGGGDLHRLRRRGRGRGHLGRGAEPSRIDRCSAAERCSDHRIQELLHPEQRRDDGHRRGQRSLQGLLFLGGPLENLRSATTLLETQAENLVQQTMILLDSGNAAQMQSATANDDDI